MAALLSLRDVGKRFDTGVEAIGKIDADIGPREFVAILGPSGCGKSTALRLIAGLDTPTRGSIAWAGERPDLGFVFQEPTLMPWTSAARNVALPLALKHVPQATIDLRVAAALARVGLTEFAGAYPRELSGGMKMRVSIARALATEPSVLLMDEPFAALDEFTRGALNDDLIELWRHHALTVLFVTHSVFESVYLANRILVMSQRPGRIVADISNDAPYPRGPNYRTSVEYNALVRRVLEILNTQAREALTA